MALVGGGRSASRRSRRVSSAVVVVIVAAAVVSDRAECRRNARTDTQTRRRRARARGLSVGVTDEPLALRRAELRRDGSGSVSDAAPFLLGEDERAAVGGARARGCRLTRRSWLALAAAHVAGPRRAARFPVRGWLAAGSRSPFSRTQALAPATYEVKFAEKKPLGIVLEVRSE